MADVLDGGEAEADGLALFSGDGGEVGVGDLDVRRDDGDVHLAALADVLDDVFGLGGFAGEQRGHELDRIVRLEPRGVVREQSVSGRVRLVEAVSSELLHQVEDLAGLVLGMLARRSAGHEDAHAAWPSRRHLSYPWHGGAGRRRRGSSRPSTLRDLHDLLLIDDDAERLVEDRLEFRQS